MILLASDHNGIALKRALSDALTEQGIPWLDFGPMSPTPPTDYNLIAAQVANALTIRRMTQRTNDYAILMCGTGIGMSVVANKVAGARAALVHNQLSAINSRVHNDANILCLGAWINSEGVNIALAQEWLGTKFGEGRHVRRIELIDPAPANRIIFSNGVFDIVHKGHVEMLKWAKSLGDKLVVAINSDASARHLKGSTRPINSVEDRRAVLQAFKFVDEVVVFEGSSPYELIQDLRPNVIVHGGDFTAEQIRMRDGVPDEIEVKVFPKFEGYSTSGVITRIREA